MPLKGGRNISLSLSHTHTQRLRSDLHLHGIISQASYEEMILLMGRALKPALIIIWKL